MEVTDPVGEPFPVVPVVESIWPVVAAVVVTKLPVVAAGAPVVITAPVVVASKISNYSI